MTNLDLLALPMMALLLGAFAFVLAWLDVRAYDRKWGRHRTPGE